MATSSSNELIRLLIEASVKGDAEIRGLTGDLDDLEQQGSSMGSSLAAGVAGGAAFAAAITAINVAARLAAEGLRLLGQQIASGIQTSADYEASLVSLEVALKNQGRFTEETLASYEAFADQLVLTSQFTRQQIVQFQALATAQGQSQKQTEALARATADYAASGLVDTDTAIRQVIKTLGGYVGELSETIPQVKELTAEQLRNGEAARIIAELYGGASTRAAETYNGAVNNLISSFKDLQITLFGPVREALSVFINNAVILTNNARDSVASLEGYRNAVIDVAIALTRGVGAVLGFATALGGLAANVPGLASAMRGLGVAIRASITDIFGPLDAEPPDFIKRILADLENLKKTADELADFNPFAPFQLGTEALLNLREFFATFQGITNAGRIGLERTADAASSLQKNLQGAVAGGVRSLASELGKVFVGAADASQEFFRSLLSGLLAAIAQALILQAILSAFPALGGGTGFWGGVGRLLGLGGGGSAPATVSAAALAGAGGFGPVEIQLSADIPMTVQRINQAQRQGQARLGAYEVFTTRTQR